MANLSLLMHSAPCPLLRTCASSHENLSSSSSSSAPKPDLAFETRINSHGHERKASGISLPGKAKNSDPVFFLLRGSNFQRRQLLSTPALLSLGLSFGTVAAARAEGGGESAAISPPATVFVAGATGKTGSLVVQKLVAEGYKVRAGVRDLEKGKALLTPGADIELVLSDVTEGPEALAKALGDAKAVIVATGFRPGLDLTAAWKVDNIGTVSLVEASRMVGAKKFVLVSSILTNAPAWGQLLNPAYLGLNIFGLVLVAKREAEKYIERSGIDYTIVRPGGLLTGPPKGNIVLAPQDTLYTGVVSRETVAEVAVKALSLPEASYKIVELVSEDTAPVKTYEALFAAI